MRGRQALLTVERREVRVRDHDDVQPRAEPARELDVRPEIFRPQLLGRALDGRQRRVRVQRGITQPGEVFPAGDDPAPLEALEVGATRSG